MKFKSLIVFLLALLTNLSFGNPTTDSLFNVLDKTIKNRDNYTNQKKQRIATITNLLYQSNKLPYTVQDEIYNNLYNEYSSFNYDSAFHYSLKLLSNAYASKNNLLINKARVKIGFSLLSAGLFKETIDTLNKVSLESFSDSMKFEYYTLLSRTYFDMADYTADTYYSPLYNQQGMELIDSALSISRVDSKMKLALTGLKYLRGRNIKKARLVYEKLLKINNLGRRYAIEASSLSFIYRYDNEPELATQMLIRAAIADIMLSTKETVAIRQLAEIVYKQGDINRASNYVKIALEDAYFFGARHRKVQISDILPIIENRQLEIVRHQRETFLIYSLAITLLTVLIVFFGIIIYRQLKKLRRTRKFLSVANQRLSDTNKRLVESNLIKEEYIAHFFNTISDYINRVEKLKVNIGRKLTTHQIEDINDIISSIDIRKERENFYHSFDSIFLKIFPNFIQEFNSFLKEKNVFPESGQLLPPELRIYALIRMGFSDNEEIARFLGYSLNTIYAYKTKIKNRLNIPVEEFEKELMKIHTV